MLAVPVAVEQIAESRQQRPRDEGIDIEIVLLVGLPEVGVADVAAARDSHGPVGDKQLVVHAPVQAREAEQRRDQLGGKAPAPCRERIEHAELELRRGRQRQQQGVLAGRVQVVEQQANPHAATRSIAQGTQEGAAGVVVDDLVVLDIERTLRPADQLEPRVEREIAAGKKAKPSQCGVGRRRLGDAAERRSGRRLQGEGGRRGRQVGQTGTSGRQQHCSRCCQETKHPHAAGFEAAGAGAPRLIAPVR